MRIPYLLVATIFVSFVGAVPVCAKQIIKANENPIEFTANSGDKTDAFEGHFFVIENRTNPRSRKIRVNYVRFPATGKKQGAPIIYLSGGPGGSGIGTAKWRRFPLFQALREFGDVIALDQRGTGASEKAEQCSSSYQLEHQKRLSKAQVKNLYVQAAKECLTHWQAQGIDVYGYTTVQNALDINDLRQHLGAEKVSLWGISYGSHLTLAAMKLFPEHIDKVIIASAEGLNQTVKLPAQTDEYFKQLQRVIDQQPLKSKVPDLTALMKRVHHKLDQQPIQIATQSRDGSENNILLQSAHLRMMASMMIADPNQFLAVLIHMYLELDAGKTDIVKNVLSRGIFNRQPISFKLMPLAMDVASGITNERLTKVEQQARSSLLEDYLNFPMPLLNNFDAKLDLGNDFRQAPKSNIPTLLLTGSLDGRTYPNEQAQAVAGLSNLTQITVKYAGHNLFTASPEVLARMKAFLANEHVNSQAIELPLPDLSSKLQF